MSKEEKKPVNITINEGKESKTDNVYENYIIQMNENLQEVNDSLRKEVLELTSSNNDLEEDLSKEENSKTYMKGLMHNLYDMKNKSFKMNDLHKKIYDKHNELVKEKIKSPLKIYLIPKTSIYMNINEYYIFAFLISPIIVFMTSIINYRMFFVLVFLSIYPGTILYFYIKQDIHKNNEKYTEFMNWYNNILDDITKITKEIEETENSCKCLDTYIDEL